MKSSVILLLLYGTKSHWELVTDGFYDPRNYNKNDLMHCLVGNKVYIICLIKFPFYNKNNSVFMTFDLFCYLPYLCAIEYVGCILDLLKKGQGSKLGPKELGKESGLYFARKYLNQLMSKNYINQYEIDKLLEVLIKSGKVCANAKRFFELLFQFIMKCRTLIN